MISALDFRLIGQGIGYSASPAMMRAAFAALGLPHRYELQDITAPEVPAAIDDLRDTWMGGANVTTPHKLAAAALVDDRSPDADRAGSVNTVVRRGRRLTGHNTDLPALIDAVCQLCPSGSRRAVVMGGGGAARSVVLALETCGCGEVVIATRSDGSFDHLSELLAEADLVVNATPIGTGTDETPAAADLLRPGLAVLDLVYRPSPTRLIREARAAGARTISGASILLGQGRRSLELWLDLPAPVDAMRAALVDDLGPDADV